MEKTVLKSFIQATLPMSEEKAELIVSKFDFLKLLKFENLIKEKNTSNYTYFLEQGFIRSYTYNTKGDEVTTNIFAGSAFVNDFLSLFKQTPARENFQALTDCKIWRMTYEDLQLCFHTIPEFREFGRMLLVTNYDILHTRVLSMIQDSAENRYSKYSIILLCLFNLHFFNEFYRNFLHEFPSSKIAFIYNNTIFTNFSNDSI